MKNNKLLNSILIVSMVLVVTMYFLYRTNDFPLGKEALGALIALGILSGTAFLLWIIIKRPQDIIQQKHTGLGLYIGLLWTIEISMNNIIQPGLPLRDRLDNSFWALIALLILLFAAIDAYKTKKIAIGIKAGFWSGLSSGAVACITALMLIVFGMPLILSDPLNIKEWSDIKNTTHFPSMSVYFAYQSFAGAIMHLVILGAIMGMILGLVGGIFGRAFSIFYKNIEKNKFTNT